MRNCRPRCRTDADMMTVPAAPSAIAAVIRARLGGVSIRNTAAIRTARHSSSRPTRVGPTTVMEGRFWKCGARKIGAENHRHHQATTANHESHILRLHHQFAELFFPPQPLMRGPNLGQRIDAVDHRLELL